MGIYNTFSYTNLAISAKLFDAKLIQNLEIHKSDSIKEFLFVVLIVAISYVFGYFVRYISINCVKATSLRHKSVYTQEILSLNTIQQCSHTIPPLMGIILFHIFYDSPSVKHYFVMRCIYAYLFITVAIALNAVITLIWKHYNTNRNERNLPIKGILGTSRGVVWLITVICSISTIIDKSPAVLLTGLGAFAAALLLIFRDSILGFVAGITLAMNDMLHVGDWIIVPSTTADGIVIDVSLTVVKVQNRDLTLVMLPPYTLISTSFINYRNIYNSNNRLIDLSIIIDPLSIKTCDNATVNNIVGKLPQLATFMKDIISPSISAENEAINGTAETNLGLYRAYLSLYLREAPFIAKQRLLIVRLLNTTPQGTPLNIYCFSADARLKAYEAITSTITEHAIAVLPIFNLKLSTLAHININKTQTQ